MWEGKEGDISELLVSPKPAQQVATSPPPSPRTASSPEFATIISWLSHDVRNHLDE
ncbi:hypothetical protein RIB2604_02103550 [Aspergillus luchuensis]|uniref:Uncharacterized protein n=1 Tax=Aspergillus kawachii TaxID=1069201 RepID=A0A146FNH7_ASPKA|nr:hypothetical protein RIB2604_02103550 [Aspergillus luchuensis]